MKKMLRMYFFSIGSTSECTSLRLPGSRLDLFAWNLENWSSRLLSLSLFPYARVFRHRTSSLHSALLAMYEKSYRNTGRRPTPLVILEILSRVSFHPFQMSVTGWIQIQFGVEESLSHNETASCPAHNLYSKVILLEKVVVVYGDDEQICAEVHFLSLVFIPVSRGFHFSCPLPNISFLSNKPY